MELARRGGGLERGDIITALDGVPVSRLVRDWSPYYAASNEPTRRRDIARYMTRGGCGESTVGVTRATGELTLKATRVPPSTSPGGAPTHDLPGETFRKLSNAVAYLKFSTIKAADVAGDVEAAAGTQGLIIDIRNYPRRPSWPLRWASSWSATQQHLRGSRLAT